MRNLLLAEWAEGSHGVVLAILNAHFVASKCANHTKLDFCSGAHWVVAHIYCQRLRVGSTAPRSEADSSTLQPMASAMRGAHSSIISSIVVS